MLGSRQYTRAHLGSLITETQEHFDTYQRLPNFAYTNDAFLELEELTLFARNWVFATLAHRLPKAGDLVALQIAGQDIILVRQKQGDIRAFHNVCPHRGAKIVDEDRSGQRAITCPYHGWSFQLNGDARQRPHFYKGGEHETDPKSKGMCGLTEIRCHQWLDFVYVNLDGKAEPFEEWMAPILRSLAPYDFSQIQFVRSVEFDIDSNWKLAMENFWDTYHIFCCHPTVDKQMDMKDRDNAVVEGKMIFGGYQYPSNPDSKHTGRDFGMPMHPGDETYIKNRSWFICCAPSNMLQVWEDALIMVEMKPVSANLTKEWFHFYLVGDGATSVELEEQREQVIGTMTGFQMEDMDIVRWLQAGRNSSAYKGGELSDFWDPQVVDFSRIVTEGISGQSS